MGGALFAQCLTLPGRVAMSDFSQFLASSAGAAERAFVDACQANINAFFGPHSHSTIVKASVSEQSNPSFRLRLRRLRSNRPCSRGLGQTLMVHLHTRNYSFARHTLVKL
jgi:hypothetical protein